MNFPRLHLPFAVLVALAAAACIQNHPAFMHERDRVNYAIQAEELRELSFRISTEVFARDLSRGDSPDSVIILKEGTKGVVVDLGEDWLRVSFDEGGNGIVFVTDTIRGDDGYWLATRAPGKSRYVKLSDQEDKILRVGAQSFRVIRGTNAFLQVDGGDLDDLIETRRHLQGRKP